VSIKGEGKRNKGRNKYILRGKRRIKEQKEKQRGNQQQQ
jgi:hypothetical protein